MASDYPGMSMVLVGGQQHVLGDVDLDPVAFADGDGRRDVDEAVEHVRARLRKARSDAGLIGFRTRLVVALIRLVASAAPEITPSAIDAPKISR